MQGCQTPPLALNPPKDKLKDKLGVSSSKARLLLELGRVDEAQALYRQLLDLNPDDYSVHEGLHRCGSRGGASRGTAEGQQSEVPE